MDPLDTRIADILENVETEAAKMETIGFPVAPITEEQVANFLSEKARLVKSKFGEDRYATATADVAFYSTSADGPREVRFSIHSGALEKGYTSNVSFAECFELSGAESPESRAREKRETAARLLAEAEALEAKKA
jgi:hypothetical protein